MKINSMTLVWAICLLPLNTFNSYGSNSINENITYNSNNNAEIQTQELELSTKSNHIDCLNELVSKCNIISPEALKMSLNAYQYLLENNQLKNKNILTVVDFSKPSTEERLFVIDLTSKKIISKSLVAHGQGSGELYATSFSNINQSFQSSLGAFVANETYIGANGLSLRLDGMETGINSNARARSVVVHPAKYVSYDFINQNGKLGRSQGCPALPENKSKEVISLIKGGSCFFIYHPTATYKEISAIYKKYDEQNIEQLLAQL